MITGLALERVKFTCGRCWYEWTVDYDVQQYRDDQGASWEYFSRDGAAVASPYTPAGAPPCPECGRHWVGRLLARRNIPAAPGSADTPRQEIIDSAGHRPERHGASLLGSTAHTQPEQPGPPAESAGHASVSAPG
ncbi:hypothetical protein ABZX75_31210 [Streptomyces sp. NPDC003038]|uniref:hypothetical protein n=1 Tax=unclassified Streptomyces TaxID=2593676 RepID=UPI0033BFAD9E